MALRVLGSASEGRSLLHRPPVGKPQELLGRLRCSDWVSLGFANEEVWTRHHLEDVVFWLGGGQYTSGPKATADVGDDSMRVPSSESEDSFAVLADFPREDLVEKLLTAYLGAMATGQAASLTTAGLAQRLRRVASAWADRGVADRRAAAGRALDGFLLLASTPEELKVVASALASLDITTRTGRSFRARSAAEGKTRLLEYFDECNSVSSFNGFICTEFKTLQAAVQSFASTWTIEAVAELSGYESSALTEKLGITPSSPRAANRCLTSLIRDSAETSLQQQAEAHNERPPPLTRLGSSDSLHSDPLQTVRAGESGFCSAEVEALRQSLGEIPASVAAGRTTRVRGSNKSQKSPGAAQAQAALAELLRQAGILPGRKTEADDSASASDEESEVDLGSTPTLLEMLKPKAMKGPTGRLLTSEAQKELEQLPEDLQQGFAEFWEENCTGVSGKRRTEALRLVYEERKRVAELMIAQRQLSSSMVSEGKIRRKHWTTGLAHDPVESILAAEVNERLTAGSLKLAFAARAGGLSLGKSTLEQYHASVRTVCLLADCLEPWEFLNNPAAESAMRRIVVLEEASRLKESVGVEKVMTKNAGFLGTAGELSERTRKRLS